MIDKKKRCAFALLCLSSLYLSAPFPATAPVFAQISAKSKKPVWPKYVPRWGKVVQEQKGRVYWTEQGKEAKALTDIRWAHEPWTGDDKPYAATRAKIESAINAGQQPAILVSQYYAAAKKEPNNPIAQFAWAYAVHLAVKSTPASEAMSSLRFSAELALSEAPLPHVYDYNRLHFLLWIQGGGAGAGYFLRDLATRLLKKDPQDFPVLVGQALIYTEYKGKPEQQHGYTLIQSLLRNYPNRPEVYDAFGRWYNSQYVHHHNPGDYQQSMNYYRKALQMYPAQSERQSQIQVTMSTLTMRYKMYHGG